MLLNDFGKERLFGKIARKRKGCDVTVVKSLINKMATSTSLMMIP